MARRSWMASLSIGLCALAGCETMWEKASSENEGELCFVAEGAVLELTIQAECLSGSCSRDLEGSCEITRDGQSIHVTSAFSWEERSSGSCTLDCVSPQATCQIDVPPDGTYTVVHGEEMSELTVPDLPACAL